MKRKFVIRMMILALACALLLTGCGADSTAQIVETSVTALSELADAALSEQTDAPVSGDQFVTADDPEQEQTQLLPEQEQTDVTTDTAVEEGGWYYDVEHVVLYLDAYGCLPDNYITKADARALGWEGGSVEPYQTGAAIGGDRFGNREGLLPEQTGRTYTECDIDTDGADARGAERLIFSNDGLYFFTSDHYASFTELFVDGGTVVWSD